MARHDLLTGLPNRLLFSEHVQAAFAHGRHDGSSAVLCLDLDRFKAVNDMLGHPAGDALLRAVARRMLACMREGDLMVRLGGDEFAVVQAATSQPIEATALAQRLIEALAEPFEIAQQRVEIGVSVGIALAQDVAVPNPEALIKCADLALYRAKADGRGCYRFFEAEMDVRMQARRALELDLRGALARGQLELFYQPQVLAGSGISGFEALLRWHHPTHGLVSPGVFIPLAEEIGLICLIGNWVLQQACVAAATWPEEVTVAVNLSPAQFRGRVLADDVAMALAATGLSPHRLELEITETVLLQDDERVLETLHALRALGVRIAMDDFGTGYSSLGYLGRFPFDKIKIDQSFVRGVTDRQDCLAIVRAVIGLGRSLGMSVVAEGVETQEQLAKLTSEGCSQIQGYLFGRPQPESAIGEMLRQQGCVRSRTPEAAVAA
jgi:diguanylate cyclase (GGDEF)-like protein